jgi:predicted RNase H-like HicB family nuclease
MKKIASRLRIATTKKADVQTRFGLFSCAFEPEPDMGGYVATAPRVSGAVSWGKNLAEAKRMIAEAIEGVLEVGMLARAEEAGDVRFVRQRAMHLVA